MRRLGAGRRHPPCSSHGKAESEHQEAKEEAMQQNVPLTWTAAWLLFTTMATAGVLGTYGRGTTNDAARQSMSAARFVAWLPPWLPDALTRPSRVSCKGGAVGRHRAAAWREVTVRTTPCTQRR